MFFLFLWGRGIVIEQFLSFFLCFFVSNITRKRLDRLHEIFREGVEWPWDDLIQFWVNSGKRVGRSKVNLFVIWFDCGLLAVVCCHLATENAMKVKLFVITGHSSESVAFARWQQRTGVNKSVAFARGRGLLFPAPQLVYFLFFLWFLAQLWRTHFWEYRHRFSSNDVFRWGLISWGVSTSRSKISPS